MVEEGLCKTLQSCYHAFANCLYGYAENWYSETKLVLTDNVVGYVEFDEKFSECKNYLPRIVFEPKTYACQQQFNL